MIIGFLGKGGSGKSSVATQMCLFLQSSGSSVLAIDADHNMDLTYNLNPLQTATLKYFSESTGEMLTFLGYQETNHYSQIFQTIPYQKFSLSPVDPITEKYSTIVGQNLRVMSAGPQTDTVLYGKACSHVLTTPLKLYLPLLKLHSNEMVVVDEKAGADGVTTGIVTGFDAGVIVCEPAFHSLKTAKQIAALMDFYGTPYVFVGNKITSEADEEFITNELGMRPTAILTQTNSIKRNPSLFASEWQNDLQNIVTTLESLNLNNRFHRTKEKFTRNEKFLLRQ